MANLWAQRSRVTPYRKHMQCTERLVRPRDIHPPTYTLIQDILMHRLAHRPRTILFLREICLAQRYQSTTAPHHPSGRHGNLPSSQSAITTKLHFFDSVMGEGKQIATYRVLDKGGRVVDGAELPEVLLPLILH